MSVSFPTSTFDETNTEWYYNNMLPKVYENFIDKEDATLICNFIDENIDLFSSGKDNLIYTLRYGKFNHFKEDDKSILTDKIKELINKYSEKIVKESTNLFSVPESYVAQAWLVKRLPFNVHKFHDDQGDGDKHLQFSGVIYLNDTGIDGGGEISFPKLNYEHKPKGGDMILFDSKNESNTHGVKLVKEDRYSIAFWTTADKDLKLNITEGVI